MTCRSSVTEAHAIASRRKYPTYETAATVRQEQVIFIFCILKKTNAC